MLLHKTSMMAALTAYLVGLSGLSLAMPGLAAMDAAAQENARPCYIKREPFSAEMAAVATSAFAISFISTRAYNDAWRSLSSGDEQAFGKLASIFCAGVVVGKLEHVLINKATQATPVYIVNTDDPSKVEELIKQAHKDAQLNRGRLLTIRFCASTLGSLAGALYG
jgi:hypothetical protein